VDPTLPGSTIDLEPGDLQRVQDWPRDRAAIDPDAPIARALDRCLLAGALFLARRSTDETALKSVRIAIRDEERWRAQASKKVRPEPAACWKAVLVEFTKARACRASRKLDKVLDARPTIPSSTAEAGTAGPRVNPLELMRALPLKGMLDLRRDLDPRAEETLYARLEAFLAGRLSHQAWAKTLCVILDARRAADRLEETRLRKWRQTFSSPQGW
jgi:hypothetical protein